jgi:hypothetical protein
MNHNLSIFYAFRKLVCNVKCEKENENISSYRGVNGEFISKLKSTRKHVKA